MVSRCPCCPSMPAKEHPHGSVIKRKRHLAICRTEDLEHQQIAHSEFDIADENDHECNKHDSSSVDT